MGRKESLITFGVVLMCSCFTLWKLYRQKSESHFLYGTYAIVFLYGVLGVLTNVSDDSGWRLYEWLGKAGVFTTAVAFPCFVTQIWLKYDIIHKYVAWHHTILGVIPAVIFTFDDRLERKWIWGIVYISSVSACVACFLNANEAGFVAAICFVIGFSIQRRNKFFLNTSPETCFNLLTAAFIIMSYIAENDIKVL